MLSIAAGVPTRRLEAALGGGIPVVRAMPNTPALVGAGAAAIAGGRSRRTPTWRWAESILGAVGIVVRVPEKLLDAVTGLSGSGPAYVFLVAEALIDAGVQVGLPRDVATALAVPDDPRRRAPARRVGRLARGAPGGGDVTGRHDGGRPARARGGRLCRAALLDAVAAATARSVELGTTT